VPHYSATEFLSAMCYLTFQDRMTNKLELRDLLSKFLPLFVLFGKVRCVLKIHVDGAVVSAVLN
jgi:hypothetical protein